MLDILGNEIVLGDVIMEPGCCELILTVVTKLSMLDVDCDYLIIQKYNGYKYLNADIEFIGDDVIISSYDSLRESPEDEIEERRR